MVSGEGLTRGAPQVFATLLREAAHALSREREIRDTSREGRYHNRRFRRMAEELGLRVERHERRGWAITELDAKTPLA
jgi:16S rRNA U516 pseudouridylate synthase RsuA-like enzyme